MASNFPDNLSDTFQNIFLAGVGALSIGGEKAKGIIDELVARGQVTVDQGRQLNEELKHKASESSEKVREDALRAYLKTLTPEEREKFTDRIADIARELGEKSDEVVAEAEKAADSVDAEEQ